MDTTNIQKPQESVKQYTLTHEDYPIIEKKTEKELLKHIEQNTSNNWDRYRVIMHHGGQQRYNTSLIKWMKQHFLPYLND